MRNEDDILALIDQTINIPCFQGEILRCIEVGLLCVQEFPEKRPSISTIISMLDREITDLPQPVHPGFTLTKDYYYPKRPLQICVQDQYCSVNNLTLTSHITAR